MRLTCRTLASTVSTFCLILTGCFSSSRLDHYHQGGSYEGGGPTISADGRIVYSSPRSGNGDLYMVDLDGQNTVQLTNDPSYECDPHFSPDGKSLVFIKEHAGQGDVWIMQVDGSGQRQITKNKADEGGPKYSSDGSKIVFWREEPQLKSRYGQTKSREIFAIEIASGAETRLTNNTVPDASPEYSPNGDMIAFSREHAAWIMRSDGGGERSIGGGGTRPSFSPSGQQVVVVAGKFGRQLDILDIDGSQKRTIYSKNTTVSQPSFFPDGSAILFLEQPKARGVGKITAVRLSDGDVQVITTTW